MRLTILLIVCIVLFALVWFDKFMFSDFDTAPVVVEAQKSGPATQKNDSRKRQVKIPENPYSDLKLTSLSETAGRPLFTKSRRPPALPRPTASVPKFIKRPEKKIPEYLLMGILKNGNQSVALLREKQSGKYYRVAKGDILGSNKVIDVFVKSIQIEHEDGTSSQIKLKFTK